MMYGAFGKKSNQSAPKEIFHLLLLERVTGRQLTLEWE